MLGFEWANTNHSSPPPQLMLSDVVDNLHHNNNNNNNNNHRHHDLNHNHNYDHIASQPMDHDHNHNHNHNRQFFDEHFTSQYTFQHDNNNTPNHSNNNNQNQFYQNHLFNDPRAYQGASFPNTNTNHSMFTLDSSLTGPTGFNHVIPKTEPDPINRPIGLNLGGRTYFSPGDDLVSRLYRRSRPGDVAANTPKCQAEGCNADLSNAKHYHRRHKVCEFHSKASTVIAAGLIQRFCQQCSRFHLLVEFDNGKRSCRKRLADHNRRRRKSHQMATQDSRMASPMSSENARTSSPSQRSPTSNNSGINSTSSVSIAMSSPPQVSFDSSFRPRLF